jgi:hypothetical protein
MPTPADHNAATVYTSIMEEAKFRALSINTLTGTNVALPVVLLRESCFLQLRMLCELIALGCMVAHGIKETKALQKATSSKASKSCILISTQFPGDPSSVRVTCIWVTTTANSLPRTNC